MSMFAQLSLTPQNFFIPHVCTREEIETVANLWPSFSHSRLFRKKKKKKYLVNRNFWYMVQISAWPRLSIPIARFWGSLCFCAPSCHDVYAEQYLLITLLSVTICHLKKILEILSSTASLLASQPALTYAGEDLKLSGCWMVAMGFQKGREKSPSKAQMDGLLQWLAWPFSPGTPLRKHPWRSWLILLPLSLIHLDILGNLDEELSIRY